MTTEMTNDEVIARIKAGTEAMMKVRAAIQSLKQQVASLQRESEGRRVALLEKAEEARREWQRAEAAEARAADLAQRVKKLEEYKVAFLDYLERTEWVQETVTPQELGMHRADVLRQRIEQAEARAAAVEKDAGRSADLLQKLQELAVEFTEYAIHSRHKPAAEAWTYCGNKLGALIAPAADQAGEV